MMKRNKLAVEICWVLLDALHADYAVMLAALRKAHEGRDGLRLSVNLRHDGSRALVKLMGPMPTVGAGCVLRSYTDADHHEAVALVTTSATELDPSAGWLSKDA